jgi:polysaccharide export outer membrane protein
MRQLIYTYLILGIIFVCSSCSDKQYQTLFQQKNTIADSLSQKTVDNASVNEYRIKSQDILQVRNLQNIKYIVDDAPVSAVTTSGGASTATGQTFQVEEDGTVTLPVIGHVPVIGLTRAEAQKLVEDTYRKSLLVNPIIELKIINLKVTILGEIKVQGNYPLIKDRTTLIELIGEAGGLTERANEKDVKIIRGTEKKQVVTEIDLGDIKSINNQNTILQSGDIVYIAQNKRAARSDNLQNFSTIFQPVLILFNTVLILFTLIHNK